MSLSIKMLRKAFAKSEGEAFAGSDDDIRSLVEGMDQKDPDFVALAVVEMTNWSLGDETDEDETDEDENGSEPVDINAANQSFAQAINLSKVLVADRDFNEHIERVVVAGEDVKRGGVVAYLDLKKHGDDYLNSLPVPKSDTGNNPAIYRGMVDGPGGKQREGDRNKYRDIALQLPKVKAWRKHVLDLRDAKGNVEGCDPKLRMLGMARLESDIKKYTARVTAAVTTLELGASIHYMLEAFRDFSGVNVDFDYDEIKGDDGKIVKTVANTLTPIIVRHPTNVTLFQTLSAKQFANLNVKKIREGGGTYEAFLSASARKRKATTKDEQVQISVSTIEAFQTATNLLSSFLDDADNNGKVYALLHKKSKGSDDLLLSIGDLRIELNTIWEKAKLQQRYATLAAAKAAEEKAA